MRIYQKIIDAVEARLKYYFDDNQILVEQQQVDGVYSEYARITSNYGETYDYFNHYSQQTFVLSLELFQLKNMGYTQIEETVINLKKDIRKYCSLIKMDFVGAKLMNSTIIKLQDEPAWKHINLILTFTILEDINYA